MMNKHKTKNIMMTLFAVVILMFTFAPNLYASSISINGSTSLTVGGSTTITISGSDITGRVNVSTSNSGVVSISKSSEWIENNSFTLTATAKAAGTAVITVTPGDVSNSAGEELSLGSKSLTITVKAPQTTTPTQPTQPTTPTTNSNANLKKLVPNYEGLSPNFNPNVTKYSLIVPATADSLKLTVAVEGAGAKYWINGENNLKIGDNTVTVTVTASDGTKKTYTIIVTKANNVKQANASLGNLVVDGKTLDPVFTAETLEYNIGTVSADIEKLTVLAYPQSDAAKYAITGHEALVDGENIIKIKVTAEDGVTTKEYSIKVTKEASVPVVTTPDEVEIYNEEDNLTETPSTFKKILSTIWAYLKEFWLVLCLLLVCILELVQIIFLYKKVNKLNNGELEENISKVDNLITPRRRNGSVDNNELENKEENVIDDITDELVEDTKKERVEEEDFTDNFEDTVNEDEKE